MVSLTMMETATMDTDISISLIDRFQNLLTSASTLTERLHRDYSHVRSRIKFYSFFLPFNPFQPLKKDLEELHATIQALGIALENIKRSNEED